MGQKVDMSSSGAHEHSIPGAALESRRRPWLGSPGPSFPAGRGGARGEELLHGNFYMVAAVTPTHAWSVHPLKCRANQAGTRSRCLAGTRLAQQISERVNGGGDSRSARGGWAAEGPEPGGAQS